jgi:hypothetical protein
MCQRLTSRILVSSLYFGGDCHVSFRRCSGSKTLPRNDELDSITKRRPKFGRLCLVMELLSHGLAQGTQLARDRAVQDFVTYTNYQPPQDIGVDLESDVAFPT